MDIIQRFILTLLPFFIAGTCYADQVIINNNPQPANSNPPTCNNQPTNQPGGLPPGTYSTKNPGGGYNTVYTTGDKQPYIVDNNCNQQPIIQPYVYAQPPYNGKPGGGNRPSMPKGLQR